MAQLDPQTNIINKRPWPLRWWAILLWIFLALVITVFTAAFFAAKNYQSKQLSSVASGNNYSDTEGQDNYWFGTSSPKITIVEFSDFSCPNSKSSFSKIRSLGSKYQDDVKIVFRDYPNISEQSLDLALAARCAGQQGKFWPMHDKLFQNQGKIASTSDLVKLAEQVGVKPYGFTKCMASQGEQYKILANLEYADKIGVKGTPTWLINGTKVDGDLPLDIWQKIIDDLIKK
ncbi:thioredoxin domain-containing protein [Candidatus Falkowbacteria bacterium]|nr:thioredoxin domain-containing protein [Candidatus Falkowbacteria bacterium]